MLDSLDGEVRPKPKEWYQSSNIEELNQIELLYISFNNPSNIV